MVGVEVGVGVVVEVEVVVGVGVVVEVVVEVGVGVEVEDEVEDEVNVLVPPSITDLSGRFCFGVDEPITVECPCGGRGWTMCGHGTHKLLCRTCKPASVDHPNYPWGAGRIPVTGPVERTLVRECPDCLGGYPAEDQGNVAKIKIAMTCDTCGGEEVVPITEYDRPNYGAERADRRKVALAQDVGRSAHQTGSAQRAT